MAARLLLEPSAAYTLSASESSKICGDSPMFWRCPCPNASLVQRLPVRLRLNLKVEALRGRSLQAHDLSQRVYTLKSIADVNGLRDKEKVASQKSERGNAQVAVSAASSSGRQRTSSKKPRVKKGSTRVLDKEEDPSSASSDGYNEHITELSSKTFKDQESGTKGNLGDSTIILQTSASNTSVEGNHISAAEDTGIRPSRSTDRDDSAKQLQEAAEVVNSETAGPEADPVDGGDADPVDGGDDPELEEGYKMSKICDRLVEIFMVEKPDPLDWRKLIVFSSEWEKIRPFFYTKLKELADQEEDFSKKADYLKFSRKLQEVEDDMARHNDLLAAVEKDPKGLEGLVAVRRKDFTSAFFAHLKLLADACFQNLGRRDEIAAIAAQCLSVLEMYDASMEDTASLASAEAKLEHVLSAPSLEAATDRINEYARKNELDSTFMLLMSKAWAAARDTNMVKEEAQDIMYHLYMVARGNMQRLVPKEVRILKHLLSMEDPRERFGALTEAFTPGPELEGEHIDTLYTTPDALYKWIQAILDAYYTNRGGSLIKEAAQLMNPLVIKRLEMLKEQMEDQFM